MNSLEVASLMDEHLYPSEVVYARQREERWDTRESEGETPQIIEI